MDEARTNTSDFRVRTVADYEDWEAQFLAPYARLSREAHLTRRHDEPQHPYRNPFQRDRDRIIHSRAFRRLKHKRQVFLTTDSDHYRTRITHTLEVAQLSRTMARALRLNEDLTEAIALGHDIGHTPFGHLGEVILDRIMSGKKPLPGGDTGRSLGGFKHNYQSLRIVDHLELKYPFVGLNLTAAVREGILKHTRLRRGQLDYPAFDYEGLAYEQEMATTLEGQVVAICDEIAQRTHDLEDGIRAGLVDLKQIERLKIIELAEKRITPPKSDPSEEGWMSALIRSLINLLVNDVIDATLARLRDHSTRKSASGPFDEELVTFGESLDPLQKELNTFIYREIIDYSRVQWSDELGEKLIFRLFATYYQTPDLLPDYILKRISDKSSKSREVLTQVRKSATFLRIVCDYIAGMTDYYAVREAERLAGLEKFKIDDLKLDAISAPAL